MTEHKGEPGSDPRLLINIFKRSAMTKEQFFDHCKRHNARVGVALRIIQNENHKKAICKLTDSQIEYYLIDKGFEDSPENVAAVRAV